MITCPNCQKQLADGTKFCDDCGAQIVETIFCANCGNQTSTEYAYCQVCGAPLAEPAAPEKKGFKMPAISKKLIGIIGAVAAVAVLIVALVLLFGGSKKNNYILYAKEGEVFYSSVSKLKPWQLTDKMVDKDGVDDDTWLKQNATDLGWGVTMSKDGKNIFYLDKYDGEFTLYYRSATNSKKDPEKLDSGISGDYNLSENGKLVTYLKDGDLITHNLKEKDKVAKDVAYYLVSDDGKNFLYVTDEGDMYAKFGNKDAKKIDSDLFEEDEDGNVQYYYPFEHVDEDFTTVWYQKEDILYKGNMKKGSKDKVVSDVYSVVKVYDSGAAYYVTAEEKEVEEDGFTYPKTEKTLYYYNGKDKKEIAKEFGGYETAAADKESVVYYTIKESKDEEGQVTYESEYHIAMEDKVADIAEEDACMFEFSEDGKTLYYICDVDKIGENAKENDAIYGELKKVTISGTKVKKTDSYEKDVYVGSVGGSGEYTYVNYAYDLSIADDGEIFYYKDYNTEKGQGTLYRSKKKVSEDVWSYKYSVDTGDVTVMVDFNSDSDKSAGTLKSWNGKKLKKISDDVHSYRLTPNGEVLYLKDYSTKKSKGELNLYNGSKSKKVDEDVVAIIPVYVPEY